MLPVFGRWLPALTWMVLIFLGSTDALSANHTSRFVEPLLRWLFTGISQARVDEMHFLIRKTGHVCEYALLALLFCWALRPWGPAGADGRSRVFRGGRALGVALLLAAVYAAGDEFHQSFVSSRGASVHDVLLDTCGALLAVLALWAWHRYRDGRDAARRAQMPGGPSAVQAG